MAPSFFSVRSEVTKSFQEVVFTFPTGERLNELDGICTRTALPGMLEGEEYRAREKCVIS